MLEAHFMLFVYLAEIKKEKEKHPPMWEGWRRYRYQQIFEGCPFFVHIPGWHIVLFTPP